jgi:hypothetical protein
VRGPYRNGKLVAVSILERLDPRHWGGRRVLRLLAGLALVALALAVPSVVTAPAIVPAAVVAEQPVAIAPADALPADDAPTAQDAAGADDDAAAQDAAAPAADPDAPAARIGATLGGTATAALRERTDAGVTGADATPPTGSTPESQGSRAPPVA